MRKNIFAVTAFIIMTAMVFTLCVNTEAKVRMSKKNLTMEVSKTHTLKLKGVKGKISWKSSDPGVAKVNKKGKVTALRKGKATITAKAGKKLYKCVVTVEDKKNTGVLNMATPKPDEPAVIPDYPTATAGQPTSMLDQSSAEPQQPTPALGLPTPKPSKSTPEPTPEPTPVQTPDNSDSELICGPCVMEYAAYMDCRISDIDESYVEISDADGEVICRFVEHRPFPGLLDPEKYYLDSPLEIVYDGILTDLNTGMPFDSYNNFFGYVAKGDSMNYSDIRIGDIVDVVYCYGLDHPEVEKRVYFCCAINVHKR